MAFFVSRASTNTPPTEATTIFPSLNTETYSAIRVSLFTDVPGSLTLQWSLDGIIWTDIQDATAVVASTGLTVQYSIKARYVRIILVNSSFPTLATRVRLNTFFFNDVGYVFCLCNLGSGVKLYNESLNGIRSVTNTGGGLTLTENATTVNVDLAASGATAGTYIYPRLTLATDGRVTAITNGNVLTIPTNIALGQLAGDVGQAAQATALGQLAGTLNQGSHGVALGVEAGRTNQGTAAISIGRAAGLTSQGNNAIALGYDSGKSNQSVGAVSAGVSSGSISQGVDAVAIGNAAGLTGQNTLGVSIGKNAGNTNQGSGSVAIGTGAASSTQGINAVSIGNTAGNNAQGANGTAVGYLAGQTTQGANATSLGVNAGNSAQGASSVALGQSAGRVSLAIDAIALGRQAAELTSATRAVHIGAGCAGGATAGRLHFGSNMEAVAATATAGAAVLPANPVAFIPIMWNGVLYKIPGYAA
jgi:hypothetical protein